MNMFRRARAALVTRRSEALLFAAAACGLLTISRALSDMYGPLGHLFAGIVAVTGAAALAYERGRGR